MSRARDLTVAARLLLAAALVIVTWQSLTPRPVALPDAPQVDKIAHLIAYLVLALLTDLSWPRRKFGRAEWLVLITYGVLIELLQSQIPNRFFSIADVVANMAGVGLYALLVQPLARGPRDP